MQPESGAGGYRESTRRTLGLVIWTGAWVVTLALARFGPEFIWGAQPVASWTAVAVNLLVGAGWIVAWTRFLRTLDDLQRKIIQDAMAATLGVGWVVGFGYVAANAAGLVADVEIAVFPALLGVVFVIAFVVGKIRYR